MTRLVKYCPIAGQLLILLIGLPAAGSADSNGGSPYSRYGLGDIRFFASGRSMGMGGAGLAVISVSEIEGMNPASWARISQTRFSGGALYEGYSASDASAS